MLNLLANILVLAGAGILTGALIPVRQLIAQLPVGSMRRRWYLLTGLIIFFIIGYLSYAIVFRNQQAHWSDLIVPGIFFFGSIFVWLTTTLSLQTANDVRRVLLLEIENITDPLMGLYNRRYLDRRLEEEYTRAQRYTLPLSVLLLDIDHFKQINDTYGHLVGDRVLNHFGELLLQAIRESDIAARYGGEEVLIVAPNTTTSSAGMLAEQLRHWMETHEMALTMGPNPLQKIRITVSIGVATLSQEISDSQDLVYHADVALYHAKHEGRNRIVIHRSNL